MNDKKTLTDVELVCQIIKAFYAHKQGQRLSPKDIYNYLKSSFILSENRIAELLESMHSQGLIMSGWNEKIDSQIIEDKTVYYEWSIRQEKDGGYFHYSILD